MTSAASSQRSDRSGRRRSRLAAPSTLASIPDLRDVESTVSSPLYTVRSDLSFVTSSRGLSFSRFGVLALRLARSAWTG